MNDIEYLRQVTGQFAMADEGADKRLESIATKYESMARAVLDDYSFWLRMQTRLESPTADPDRQYWVGRELHAATHIERATGKHPSDWTRDGLMKHLGVAQEADDNE